MNESSSSPSSPAASMVDRWRFGRRALLGMAALATLIGIFYTVENWRGKRAWEARRQELEAKGEVLDWAAYIPPPVPDDQNFYKAPNMNEWFVKDHFAIGGADPTNVPQPFVPAPRKHSDLLFCELTIAQDQSLKGDNSEAILRLKDPDAPKDAARRLSQTLGPLLIAARNGILLARPVEQIKPLRWVMQSDSVPTQQDVAAFFNETLSATGSHASPTYTYVQVDPVGTNAFRVSLRAPAMGAADYLAWTDPLAPQLELVRKALERPYARIDCDYQVPFAIGIPNFVRIRTVVQTLAERAQSHLLLGQPDAALRELTLLHDLCRILEVKPSKKPITLVGAMIDVAVKGLYAGIIKDGLQLHAWGEPQLGVLEQQLRETDLLAPVVEACREERAATCRTFEITSRKDLLKLFNASAWEKPLLYLAPRGWFFQNMAAGSAIEQEFITTVDLKARLVHPAPITQFVSRLSSNSWRRSPYTFLVAMAVPNFAKAMQNTARNQTLVNEAEIACALERYRLANGKYPETLQGAGQADTPHDLIGGHDLTYRRTEAGGYVLYSVGWNEKDDGGTPGKSNDDGDWVWEIR